MSSSPISSPLLAELAHYRGRSYLQDQLHRYIWGCGCQLPFSSPGHCWWGRNPKGQRLFDIQTRTSLRDSCRGCSGVWSGAWRHDSVHVQTLWSVHPVSNSLKFPGHLWRRLYSFLHLLSPEDIILARCRSPSGGLAVNSRDREMPTQWGPAHTTFRVVSEVARAAVLSTRVPTWLPYCLVDRAEFSVLPCPIHSVPYQFSCVLLYTHTGAAL